MSKASALPTLKNYMTAYGLKSRTIDKLVKQLELSEDIREDQASRCDGFLSAVNGHLLPYGVRVYLQRGRAVSEYLAYREIGRGKSRLNFSGVFQRMIDAEAPESTIECVIGFEEVRIDLNSTYRIQSVIAGVAKDQLSQRKSLLELESEANSAA